MTAMASLTIIDQLNNSAWQRVRQYQRLPIAGHEINCPYAINLFSRNLVSLMKQVEVEEELISTATRLYKERRVGYGWYRGKGTPEEIVEAAESLAKRHGYNLANCQPEGVVEFMKLFGLGVDCSGFVWHLLDFAWSGVIGEEKFLTSFAWPSQDQVGVNYAGAQFLADHSELIEPSHIQPLDLVCIGQDGHYTHIAMILKDEKGDWQVVQSNIDMVPTGVYVSGVQSCGGSLAFDHKPVIGASWNDYLELIEFRRLRIF